MDAVFSCFYSIGACAVGCFPGYAFLLFQEESSVQALIEACMEEDGKLYLCVSSPTIKDKPVSPSYSTSHGRFNSRRGDFSSNATLFRCKFDLGT